MNNKIAIVEDHPVLASIYQKRLASEGYHVEVASDGQEGLDLINQIVPDLAILDLIMPKLNGIEVIKSLRSNSLFKSLPILVFSNSEWAGEALAEGATMVVSKSTCTAQQVVEMVRNLLPIIVEHQLVAVNPQAVLDISLSATSPFPNSKQSQDAIKHILLVEDQEDTRALISCVLVQSGCRVTVAESHEATLQKAEQEDFDLYMLNRYRSDGLGLSLCRELRLLHPSKVVVLYSTEALPKEQQEALNAGANAYLTKLEDILNPLQTLTNLFNREIRPTLTTSKIPLPYRVKRLESKVPEVTDLSFKTEQSSAI